MTPPWDPPKLLLVVVSGRHVVVGTSGVVGVVVEGDVKLLGSSIWLRQLGRMERGKRGRKATVSFFNDTATTEIYTTYAWVYV